MKYCPLCASKLIPKRIDGVDRLACASESCDFIFWNNPVPVVAALVEHDGAYVIARNALWPEGVFSVITGYLEVNESPERAALREVQEELSLSGTIKRLIGNYSFPEKNQIVLCYEVHATGSIQINKELAEWKRLSKRELSEYDFKPLYITERIVQDWRNLDTVPDTG